MKAYENLAQLRNADTFGAWLLKITQNCANDYLRQKLNVEHLDIALAEAVEKPNGQLDEEKQELLVFVNRLTENEKQLIMLRYFSCHSVRDISKILGRSIGTVTKQLSRAHQSLRKLMIKEVKL